MERSDDHFRRLRNLPRIPLLTAPEPRLIEADELPGLRVASDSHVAPLYGGNKARKLEFLLAEALRRHRTRVATIGAWGSNHCLATAAHARAHGLDVTVHHFPQPVTDHVRDNLLAVHALGAELVPHRNPVAAQAALLAEAGKDNTHVIPGGGTSVEGVLGYVLAADDLRRVWGDQAPPDELVVAAGTCGTLAGLILGLGLLGWTDTHIRGVRVTSRVVAREHGVRRLLRAVGRDFQFPAVTLPAWSLDPDVYAPGYGRTRPGWPSVRKRAAALEGLHLEPTYTGRAMESALTRIVPGRTLLYWHTLNQQPLAPLMAADAARSPLPSAYDPALLTSGGAS